MPSHDSALPARIAPPPAGWTGGRPARTRPERRPRARREVKQDRPTAAMVFGIVSLVFNVLLLPSLIGILYGARSLRVGTAHRGQAIAGIVTGSIGALVTVVALGLRVALLLAPVAVSGAHVAASITASSAEAGTPLTAVVCPDVPVARAGTVITCSARAADGGPVTATVTFSGSGTGFDWRATRSA